MLATRLSLAALSAVLAAFAIGNETDRNLERDLRGGHGQCRWTDWIPCPPVYGMCNDCQPAAGGYVVCENNTAQFRYTSHFGQCVRGSVGLFDCGFIDYNHICDEFYLCEDLCHDIDGAWRCLIIVNELGEPQIIGETTVESQSASGSMCIGA